MTNVFDNSYPEINPRHPDVTARYHVAGRAFDDLVEANRFAALCELAGDNVRFDPTDGTRELVDWLLAHRDELRRLL